MEKDNINYMKENKYEVEVLNIPDRIDINSFLKEKGYTLTLNDLAKIHQVLIFPDSYKLKEDTSFELLTSLTVELKKELSDSLSVELLIAKNKEHAYIDRRSADVILPILIFLSKEALAVATGIISAKLYDLIKNAKNEKKYIPTVEYEYVLIEGDDFKQKRRLYRGPADKIVEIIKQEK